MDPADRDYEALRTKWIDKFVEVVDRPELLRFKGIIGRVITVNYNRKAIIDFQDGAWYDITASEEYLRFVAAETAKGKYDGKVNSAQPVPDKQG